MTASVTATATGAVPGRATDPAVDVVPMGRADADDVLAIDQWAFAFDRDDHLPHEEQVIVDSLEWDRTYGARRGDPRRLAGVYSVVSGELTLVGGAGVRASGLTWVGVHPRDRRRGVLTAMMRHHLADVAARGETLSVLYAAEASIYGRFGYGAATRALTLRLPRGAALRDVPGAADLVVDVDHADRERYQAVLAECFERARRARPGWLSRDRNDVWAETFLDPRRRRRGAETLRLLTVSTADGELRGYALFRRHQKWENEGPASTVEVREAVTLDGAAARTLWSRLTDLDLTVTVMTPYLPVDDPLLHLLVDPRAALPRGTDGLWARIVDVPRALAQRRYSRDVDVVLEVTDALLPANAGRWHLAGGPEQARCEPTDAPAQLTLDVRELGTVFLGGPTLAELASAGLVTAQDPAALAPAAAAFASPVAPHCGWNF